ncbi:Ti-type conjugative transfer relaxase TraA [uncultured Roseobacter sp.]|uniref:Ti-type conjugative transfer relaxase TraA n=1 Tax=uncultured Roseobacter sp. TaxID=114847 RepID=UPI0026265079|nr:Ti-type conjugative transfer relaxase TraA [uncultured Roseobacter sp.]
MAAAAYRAGVCLTNARDEITHDFTNKRGVLHAEIVLPEGVEAAWVEDRSDLWNGAEAAEKRKDARVAREFEVALPHELDAEQRLQVTRDISQMLADRYGAAVDFAIHAPHDEADVRNHHAHILITTRQVTADGLGEKTHIERENKWLLANSLATTDMQLRELRQAWEMIVNERLALAGFDVRIDHRSHMARGLEIIPTEHMGVQATHLERLGLTPSRVRLGLEAAKHNADLIRDKPEQVLDIITAEKSVFNRRDVARTLHRYINEDAIEFQVLFAKVMASPALVELQAEYEAVEPGDSGLALYSTKEMVDVETGILEAAVRLHASADHVVDPGHVVRAIATQDAAIEKSSGDPSAGLSDEQRGAIKHITGAERVAAVVGFAGAGKSTMLAAAREAWEAQGYRVRGAALSGKAAEGLEESSGIPSRTLASWTRSWDHDRNRIGKGDVFVIDEAGMVGSRQLAGFVAEVEARGAKIVLVGDHEQLQAIGAGAPFRAITEFIGRAELSEIRRQRVGWQRDASVAFATHRTAEALAAYRDQGAIELRETGNDAIQAIARDYLTDGDDGGGGTRVAMAHRRVDVRAINDAIRAELQARGTLARVEEPGADDASAPAARRYQTNDGARDFAVGDRVVFLENNRDLGVKNGMLGTVASVADGRLGVMLDGRGGAQVSVSTENYKAIDHGYATTIHKTQGTTVDRAFVLASRTMDRQLAYVAMTRHRTDVKLYAAMDEFADKRAGRLVAHGVAPYENNPDNKDSYFVTLESAGGKQHTLWSKDLGRVMAEVASKIGDEIALQHLGSTPVTLPDGTQTHRNTWKLQTVDQLVHAQLENRLSRSGLKSSTLDYINGVDIKSAIAFGERRGLASEQSVLRSVRNTIARQAKRLAGLVTRLTAVAPEVSRSSEWLIAPLVEADRDAAQLARDRALVSPKVAEAERDLQTAAAKVFRNPDAAMLMFRQLLNEPADAADRMASRVLKDPESIAALRGGTGLMAGRAAREERAAAIAAIPPLRRRISDYRGMFGAMEAQERGIESERRERLGVGIPALSQEASSLLQRLDGAAREGNTAFAATFDQARKDAPDLVAGLEGFQAALSKRLGPLERFLAGHDDFAPGEVAKTDRKHLMAHIPKLRQLQCVKRSIEEQRRLEQSRDQSLRQ